MKEKLKQETNIKTFETVSVDRRVVTVTPNANIITLAPLSKRAQLPRWQHGLEVGDDVGRETEREAFAENHASKAFDRSFGSKVRRGQITAEG